MGGTLLCKGGVSGPTRAESPASPRFNHEAKPQVLNGTEPEVLDGTFVPNAQGGDSGPSGGDSAPRNISRGTKGGNSGPD